MLKSALILCLLATSIIASEKPNILFILTDDQCFDAIGAHGEQHTLQTPNIDRLTQLGTTFQRAYNIGSWKPAVCVSSRTALVTGASIWKAQSALEDAIQGEIKLWPQYMKDLGYDTYLAGKWHVEYPAEQAFDVSQNVRKGMPRAKPSGAKRSLVEGAPLEWLPWDTNYGGFWEGGKHWSEVTADDCISFLHTAQKSKNPFFMYIGFNAPHDPRQSGKNYIEQYPLEDIELPSTYMDSYPDQAHNGVPIVRDEKLAPFPRTPHAIKVNIQEYYAIITHLDEQIGRILETLESQGILQDTWIVFTSDHGLAIGKHGLLGKQNLYEHSLRAPFIICSPQAPAGKTINTPIFIQDIMPTLLEVAGGTPPAHVNFKSLLPLLQGSSEEHYSSIYTAYTNTQRSIIEGDWKLICYPQRKVSKLFNLDTDPLEKHNLATDATYAAKLKSLTQLLETQMNLSGDPMTSLTHPRAK